MAVTGQDVADFLGRGDDGELAALAEQHATIVTAMARAYTRGNGFDDVDPNDEIAAVITTATARLVSYPDQAPSRTDTAGPMSHAVNGAGFTGWTLAELFVLNRYRKRAQ
ncbi:hypothetical protein [Gordonia sp. NB41Y]|uniref:hypothetical protein n=1 Tax=Gordonia sp. NB41Y TaxID=875808 RepID=UPI0002BE9C19|nr:hypothetical protein [Gordonia sp. NB41Y]KOY49008.1 hypothetical protein ISGA_12970 [Gordonia sp. NB41Y]WLP90085.1 hypothetical protein Q9K23_21580 [Gordonia sp. NB41Y]